MAINFPASLDDFTDYVDGTTVLIASTLNNMQLGIEANQAKIGIDTSAVTSSHDYKIAQLESGLLIASGAVVFNTTMAAANTFQDLDLSATVGSKIARCLFEIKISGTQQYIMRHNTGVGTFAQSVGSGFAGPTIYKSTTNPGYCWIVMDTDASGIIEHGCSTNSTTVQVTLINYIL